jgi:YD repeat-containing protein
VPFRTVASIRTLVVLLIPFILSWPCRAQDTPARAHGFNADKVYQFGDVDSINIFNGGVVIPIALGQQYRVSDGLSYGLSVVYNGNMWDYTQRCYFPDATFSYTICKNEAYPSRFSNAGAGFLVTLGELLEPTTEWNQANTDAKWIYVSPDGARHAIGSGFERLRLIGLTIAEVDFPDGTTRRFEKSANVWRLTEIRDRYAAVSPGSRATTNFVHLNYTTWIEGGEAGNQIDVVDSVGRTQHIKLIAGFPDPNLPSQSPPGFLSDDGATANAFVYPPTVRDTVRYVDVAGPLGALDRYTFDYDLKEGLRGPGHNQLESLMPSIAKYRVLRSLTLPDGSKYSFQKSDSSLGYGDQGELLTFTLPTGGRITYTYTSRVFPNFPPQYRAGKDPYEIPPAISVKVATRELLDSTPGALPARWTYTEDYAGGYLCLVDGNLTECPPLEMKVTLTDPLGNRTENFFSLAQSSLYPPYSDPTRTVNPYQDGWRDGQYGLPFTVFHKTDDGTRLLSTRSYDATGHLLRSTYVKYDADDPNFDNRAKELDLIHPRVRASRTVFEDDHTCGANPCYIDDENDFASYDGFGHYRRHTTTSNFGPTRETFTNYNSDPSPTDRLGKRNGVFAIATGDPWIINRYDLQTVTEGAQTSYRRFCFSKDTGRLERTRTMLGASPASGDLVAALDYDDDGNLTTESYYGGDGPIPAPADLCGFKTGNTTPQFAIRHKFQKGLRTNSYYIVPGSTDSQLLSVLDVDLDLFIGLPVVSRDGAGVATQFSYQSMSRLGQVHPAGTGWTEYTYKNAGDPGYPFAAVIVDEHGLNPGNQDILTENLIEFDGFGRVYQETTTMPGGGRSTRRTTYNGNGWKTSVSERGTDPAAHVTTYTDFDPFGRARTITAPDGSQTRFNYTGTKTVARTVTNIAVPTGPADATTTETYDAYGRLTEVEEPSGTPSNQALVSSANVLTHYQYDVGNHLTRVESTDLTVPSHDHQLRTFTYDLRGLLTDETHPEKGTTYYRGYDARGHLLRKQDGTSTKYDLTYIYDSTERLTQIQSTPTGDAIKEFVFDAVSDSAHTLTGKGRLLKSVRHNRSATLGDVQVADYFTYDSAGRVSSKETRLSTGPVFTQSFTYTDLNQPDIIHYPTCSNCGSANKPDRSIRLGYSYGLLTGVDGFTSDLANGITYWPNGMVRAVNHTGKDASHGTVDTQGQDLSGMPRPASINYSGYCVGPTLAAPAPSSVTVVSGGTADFAIAAPAGVAAPHYQWFKGARGVTTNPVAGATSASVRLTSLTESTTYWVRVTGDDGCSTDSQVVTVNIRVCDASTLSITTQPKSAVVLTGTGTILTVAASDASATYEWFQGASGSTANKVGTGKQLDTGLLTQSTSFWVRVHSADGLCTVDSITAVVDVCSLPIIIIQPQSQTKPLPGPGQTATLTASVTAIGYGLVRYEWYNDKDNSFVAGGPTLSIDFKNDPIADPNWSNPRSYYVKVYDTTAVTGCNGPVKSDTITLRVVAPSTCLTLASGAADYFQVSPARPGFTLTILVEGPGTLTYRWFHGTNGQKSQLVWNGPSLGVSQNTFTNGDYDAFWCEVSSSDCPDVLVTPKSYGFRWGACPLPPVTVIPSRFTADVGSGLTPKFTAYVDWPRVSYQWYKGQSGDISQPWGGATNATFTPDVSVTTSFWVRVTAADTNGCYRDSGTAVFSVGGCDPAFINAQPQSVDIPAGGTATLHTDASSALNVVYDWYDKSSSMVHVGTGPTLTVSPAVSKVYVARISSLLPGGVACCSVDTVPVSVHVKSCAGITITQQPQNTTVPDGVTSSVDLSVVATASEAISYQWYIGAVGDISRPIPGATASLVHVTQSSTTSYWVRMSTSTCIVDSNAAVVSSCIAPHWSRPMTGASMQQGQWVLLESTAEGSDLTYEWYLGSTVSGTPVSTARAFWINPSDTTTYVLKVSGMCGTLTSAPVTFSVCVTPAISEQPKSTAVFPGKTATLHTTAFEANHVDLSYTWLDEMNVLVGGNSPTLVTPPITTEKTFSVWVAAGVCSARSQEAAVSLCALPEEIATGTTQNVSPGQVVILQALLDPNSSNSFQWYRGAPGDVSNPVGNDSYQYGFLASSAGTYSYWAKVTHADDGCVSHTNAYVVNVCVPVITQQPANITLMPDQPSVPLSVVANPAGSYQWYIGEKGDITSAVPGGTTATINVKPTADTRYWARVTGTCAPPDRGDTPGTNSESALVTVCQPPAIVQASQGASIVLGTSFTLGVNATGMNLTYQWYTGATGNISSPIAGATAATLTVSPSNPTNYWVRITGSCGTKDSATMVVTVCARPMISAQPQNVTIFSGATATLTVTAMDDTTTPLAYQWYRGAAGDMSNPVGTNSPAYTTPALTSETSYWVRISCGVCTPTDSDAAIVSMCTYPPTHTPPPDVQAAVGQLTRLTAFGSTGTNSYRWFRGASGDTSSPLGDWQIQNYIDVSPTVTTQYWYKLQDGTCVSNSGTVTVFVCIPTITTQPVSQMINPGASLTLSVVANTTGLTYQWYTGSSGTTSSPIAGATSSTVTVSPAVDTNYWVRVTGSCSRTADSNTAAIIVCQPPAIVQASVGGMIALGSSFSLGVNATGTNLTYQWYSGTSGNLASPIAGATNVSVTVSPANTTSYWVRITGTCGTKDSATMTVRVCGAPTINTQPQNASIFSGATATLSIVAVSATSEPLNYQWYRGASGDQSNPVGTSSPTFTTPSLTADTSYWVLVSSGICTGVASDTAVVSMCPYGPTVIAPPDVQVAIGQITRLTGVGSTGNGYTYRWFRGASGDTSSPLGDGQIQNYIDVSPTVTTQYWYKVQTGTCISNSNTVTVSVCIPTITTQPGGQMINPGASATLSVVANTSGLTYQWYVGASGTTTSPIAGATSSTVTVSPTVNTNYWVRVTGSCGRTADSTTAAITVCQPPTIVQPAPGASIVLGSSATLGVVATGTNLSYQWYTGTASNTSSPIAGGTGANQTVSPSNTTSYWVRITGTCGTKDSATMTVTVCSPPVITTHPQSISIFSGMTTTLSVTATDLTTTPLVYQWYRGASGEVSAPVGTNASTFTTPALTSETSYWVRVSCGGCTPADSQAATVSICLYPQTLAAPPNVQTAIGELTRLAGVLTSVGNGYQWFRGAAGDTSNPYTPGYQAVNYIDVAPTVTTQYWYRLQNSTCVSSSGAVTVNVCVPQITTQPANATIASGSSATLSVAANTVGVTYQWYVGSSPNTATPVSGGTSPSLTVSPTATTSYWARATSSCGRTVDSLPATVTVCQAPAITRQPNNGTPVNSGQNAFTDVAASGTNLAYQWYFGESGNTSNPIACGARDACQTSTSTSLSLLVYSSVRVWVRVSGMCGSANSNAVWLSVNPGLVSPLPPESINVGYGSTVSIQVNASGTDLHYAWKDFYGALVPGSSDSSTLIIPSVTANMTVYCDVTSALATRSFPGTAIFVCDGPYIISTQVTPYGTNCKQISVNVANPYAVGTYLWYQGPRGDVSHPITFATGNSAYGFCAGPTATSYWCRVVMYDDFMNVSCYSDTAAVPVP